MRVIDPNKYPGKCAACGTSVAAGAGVVFVASAGDRWQTCCKSTACARKLGLPVTTAPAGPPRREITEAPRAVRPSRRKVVADQPPPSVSPAATTTFETEWCSRCGGCGKFSHCEMYGDTCFKCGGSGVVLTKRGAAAKAKLTELRSKRADEIVVGDVVWFDGGRFTSSGWFTVDKVSREQRRGASLREGKMVDYVESVISYSGIPMNQAAALADGRWGGLAAPDKLVRVRQTPEQAQSTLAEALAYQATLTITGEPKRGRARKNPGLDPDEDDIEDAVGAVGRY